MSSSTTTELQDDPNQISIIATNALIVPSTAVIHNDVFDDQPFVAINAFTQTPNLIFLMYIPQSMIIACQGDYDFFNPHRVEAIEITAAGRFQQMHLYDNNFMAIRDTRFSIRVESFSLGQIRPVTAEMQYMLNVTEGPIRATRSTTRTRNTATAMVNMDTELSDTEYRVDEDDNTSHHDQDPEISDSEYRVDEDDDTSPDQDPEISDTEYPVDEDDNTSHHDQDPEINDTEYPVGDDGKAKDDVPLQQQPSPSPSAATAPISPRAAAHTVSDFAASSAGSAFATSSIPLKRTFSSDSSDGEIQALRRVLKESSKPKKKLKRQSSSIEPDAPIGLTSSQPDAPIDLTSTPSTSPPPTSAASPPTSSASTSLQSTTQSIDIPEAPRGFRRSSRLAKRLDK